MGRSSLGLTLLLVLLPMSSLAQPVGTVSEIPMISGFAGIALEAGGATMLVNQGQAISRLDLATRAVQTLINIPFQARFLGPRLVLEEGGQSALTFEQSGCGACPMRLMRVNVQTGAITPLAEGLTRPVGLAIEPGGATALVTQGGTGLLSRVDLATGAVSTVAGGLGTSLGGIDLPAGVAIESGGQTALVASREFDRGGVLYRVDLQTGATSMVTVVGLAIREIALEAGGGTAIAVVQGGCCQGDVYRVDLASGVATHLYTTGDPLIGSNGLFDLVLEPGGGTALSIAGGTSFYGSVLLRVNLGAVQSSQIVAYAAPPKWVTLEGYGSTALVSAGPAVFRVNLATGSADRVSPANLGAEQVAIEAGGATAVVANRDFQGGGLFRLNLIDGTATTIVSRSLVGVAGVSVEPGGLAALATGEFDGTLWRVNLANGQTVPIVSGLVGLIGVAVEAGGQTALVTQGNGSTTDGIYRIDLTSGQGAIAVQNLEIFEQPAGVVIESGGTSVLFAARMRPVETGQSGLFRANLTTGIVVLVAALPTTSARGVALEANGETALVAAGDRLLRVVVGEAVAPPVLTVTPVSLDFGQVVVGSSADLGFTVRNDGEGTLAGTASASAPFSILGGSSFSLGAGQSQAVTVRFSPPSAETFVGNVQFASSGGDVSPGVRGQGISVPASQPDLVATSLSGPTTAAPGARVEVVSRIANQGNASAPESRVRFYFSRDAVFDPNDEHVASLTVPALVGGAERSAVTPILIPRTAQPGSYYILAVVDVTNLVGESDEGNNTGAFGPITIGVGLPSVPPTLQSLSPWSGAPGIEVRLNGRDFGSVPGTVRFGTTEVSAREWTNTRLQVTVPELSARPYDVTVTTVQGTSNGAQFTIPAPRITRISPNAGRPGAVVSIAGRYFGRVNEDSHVFFGGAEATVVRSGGAPLWSDSLIEVVAPATAPTEPDGEVRVTVTTSAGRSNEKLFTYSPIVPMILVHGFCGSAQSFGSMASLLATESHRTVESFEYNSRTVCPELGLPWGRPTFGDRSTSIRRLAADFAVFVEGVRKRYGASQVDVVAHSMGGLVARAWMAGLAVFDLGTAIEYEDQIRRIVLIATPSYGAEPTNVCRTTSLCQTQEMEMRFGSHFVWDLHASWGARRPIDVRRVLLVVGTNDDDELLWDGVVDLASAALPLEFGPSEVRYVPYRHTDVEAGGGSSVAIAKVPEGVVGKQHLTFRLVEHFAQTGHALRQSDLGYQPRRELLETGLVLVRLVDRATQTPVAPHSASPPEDGDPIDVDPRVNYTGLFIRSDMDAVDTAGTLSVTCVGRSGSLTCPRTGAHVIRVVAPVGYQAPRDFSIRLDAARPTVPAPIELRR